MSSASFFRPGDKITLPQTDVEISAENGLEFGENQTIGIYVPPSVRFFSGKDSVLSFDVKLQTDDTARPPTMLQLDSTIGANSLFSRCRAYVGNRQQLIEELDEYATAVHVAYSYESNETIRNKRALTEGCGAWVPECRGTCGTHKSGQTNVMSNPYFKKRFMGENRRVGSSGAGDSDSNINVNRFQSAHVEVPIHLGCFARNSKAFPNILTDGIYLELETAPGRSVFRGLDNVTLKREFANLPRFNGAETQGATLGATGALTKIYIDPTTNMQIDAQHCPFSVGEEIGIYDSATGNKVVWDVTGTNLPPKIKSITTEVSGGKDYIVLNIDDTGGRTTKAAHGTDVTSDTSFWLYSNSLKTAVVAERVGTWTPKYTISNVNLKVRKIDVGADYESGMMAKMKSGGVIEFDIPSVQCHKNSILKSDRQATINISIEHAKAKSIICVPTNAAIVSAEDNVSADGTYVWLKDSATFMGEFASDQSSIAGCGNFLKDYSYQLNGLMVPSRAVDTSKTADPGTQGISGTALLELEKALTGASIRAMSFKDYKRNFIIGRALAMDSNTIYNGIGVDTRLLLQYEGGTDAERVDTLWKNFVYHIKTISIKGEGITIQH